jgi:hypothetical protein
MRETSTKTGGDGSRTPRVYTIWPAQEDLPAVTSGPWHQERRWLVLDVTDGIAASYVVEGPVEHTEAIRRAAEIRTVVTEDPRE